MASRQRELWMLREVTGYNLVDPPISLLPGQVRIADNIDLFDGGIGKKRRPFVSVPDTGTEPINLATSVVLSIFRHTPAGRDGPEEIWVPVRNNVADTITMYRWISGTWSTVALADTPASGTEWSFATFNSKLFIAYDSPVNRLHVWDGVSVRRVGMAPPAVAPVLQNLAAGGLSFTRFYRVRFRTTIGAPPSTLLSEPSPSATITIVNLLGVRILRPALVDGNESAWHIDYANSANGPWFEFAQVAIGTTFFDDTSGVINTSSPSREVGLFTLPPSAKFLSVYQNQILMAGAWETTSIAGQSVPTHNRVWFTRPSGSLEISDDEAITTTLTLKFYVDTGEDNERISGLSYPLDGIPYTFKPSQIWSLIPRDDPEAPFAAVRLTDSVGCTTYKSIVIGEDESGSPALYWGSERGPYRLSRAGIQFIGRDLLFWNIGNIGVWFPELRQLLFGAGSTIQVFNVRLGRPEGRGEVRHGWVRYIVNTMVITAMAVATPGLSGAGPIQPLIGGQTGTAASFIWQRGPVEPLHRDGGTTAYRSYIETGEITLGQFLYNATIYPPRLYWVPGVNSDTLLLSTIECQASRNLTSFITDIQSASLQPSAFGLAFFIGNFEGINWSDGETYAFRLGEMAPVPQAWTLYAFMVPYKMAEEAE